MCPHLLLCPRHPIASPAWRHVTRSPSVLLTSPPSHAAHATRMCTSPGHPVPLLCTGAASPCTAPVLVPRCLPCRTAAAAALSRHALLPAPHPPLSIKWPPEPPSPLPYHLPLLHKAQEAKRRELLCRPPNHRSRLLTVSSSRRVPSLNHRVMACSNPWGCFSLIQLQVPPTRELHIVFFLGSGQKPPPPSPPLIR